MTGARYFAEERGTFDGGALAEASIQDDPPIQAALAPLIEIAAAHDGQPAGLWALMFYRWFGWQK
jgi:hypothetical protein